MQVTLQTESYITIADYHGKTFIVKATALILLKPVQFLTSQRGLCTDNNNKNGLKYLYKFNSIIV